MSNNNDEKHINNKKIDLFQQILNGFTIPEGNFRLKNEDFRGYFKPEKDYIDIHNIKTFKKAANIIYSSINSKLNKLNSLGAEEERLKDIKQKIIALNFKINVIMRQKNDLKETLTFVNENIKSIFKEINDLIENMNDQSLNDFVINDQSLDDFVKATIFINFHTKNDGYIENILIFLKFIFILAFCALFIYAILFIPLHFCDERRDDENKLNYNKKISSENTSFVTKWSVYTIPNSLKDIMKEFNVAETSVKDSILNDKTADKALKKEIMYSHFI